MPTETDTKQCEDCGDSFEKVCIRSILMETGERELLCEPCFENALDDGRVSPMDPRLPGENA